ncbi:hypothetical protein SCLCIDRAFT_24719 [Scleroderma citrinum Foug A]|uniref:Uncharacterized protein n=1 Tax=Scleroderma citrinum Foug A TaxID=1036808 RepID=A0A0C2ZMU8_9AGAM|nr:hypothetical protein SCLCIDRAFT_24719 [Scleroderma citrinum Foug A]
MLGLQDRLRCGSDRSGNITTAYEASKASITTSRPGSAKFPPRFHGGHNPVSLSPVEMDRTSVTLVLRPGAYLPTRQLFQKACLNASTRTQSRRAVGLPTNAERALFAGSVADNLYFGNAPALLMCTRTICMFLPSAVLARLLTGARTS